MSFDEMVLRLRTFVAFGLTVTLALSSAVRAGEHGVAVMSASPAALTELNHHLPTAVSNRLGEMVLSYAGPLTSAVSLNSPAGFWVDWHDETPRPVLVLKNFDQTAFKHAVENSGLTIKSLDGGVSELVLASPVYFREANGWFYLATAIDDLREVSDPLADFGGELPHAVSARIHTTRIPQSARAEIAKVVATRFLPPAISGGNALDLDGLIHLYASRLMNEFTSMSEIILVSIDSDSSELKIGVDVEGIRLSSLVQKSPRTLLAHVNDLHNGIAMHTSLSDEEVARLMWWAKSLPDQFDGAFEQATIEDRKGKQAVAEAVKAISELIGKTTVQGELEAFGTLVGAEMEIPLVGVRVHSGEWVDEQLRQWVDAGHASELQISGVEFEFETINGVKLHRFTIAEPDAEAFAVTIGIGANQVFLTSGQDGLLALREILAEQSSSSEVPSPLQLNLDGVTIASAFGWMGEDERRGRLVLNSVYTDLGIRYEAKFVVQN